MKTFYKNIISLMAILSLMLTGCGQEYEKRVFKQHLMARITEATALRDNAVIGTNVGEYKPGSKDPLIAAIDEATAIYWEKTTSQQTVDDAYASLDEVMVWFLQQENPDKSILLSLINQCNSLVQNTQVGTGDGMVSSQDDINALQAAVEAAEAFITANPNMTKPELDAAYDILQAALFAFEGKIQGKANVFIINHSFEEPGVPDGTELSDFDLIPGWNSQGPIVPDFVGQSWVNPVIVSINNWRPRCDGVCALWTQGYYGRIWQITSEGLHTNSRYDLSAYVVPIGSWGHPDVRLRMELLVFKGAEGDFSNIEVLKYLEVTEITQMSSFALKSLTLDTPATSDYTGKRLVIAFRGYITKPWNSNNDEGFVFDQTSVGVDNVTLTREKLQ
jgi:hypothetical protein